MIQSRRDFLCVRLASEFSAENTDSPFYEHFHQLSVPVAALMNPPQDGIVVKTLPVDQGSYDIAGFNKFIASSGLKADSLRSHDHDVRISNEQLIRIAQGEKDVEIKVISQKGNYVHNFFITASPMVLATIKVQLRKLKSSEIL
jgi:hypothetical protein